MLSSTCMGTFTSRLVEDAVWRCLDGCIRRLEAPLRADAHAEQSQVARLLDRLIARVESWHTLALQQRNAARAAEVPCPLASQALLVSLPAQHQCDHGSCTNDIS